MPTPASASTGAAAAAPSPATILEKLDLMIWLTLSAWPALALAVQNGWGGAETAAKRDWFAGAVSELLADTAPADLDAAYVEEVLLQVMQDEFEVVVDDGSPAEVAMELLERRARILKGDFGEVEDLRAKWEEKERRGGREKVEVRFVRRQRNEDEDEDEDDDGDSGSDDSEEDDEDEDDEGDVQMGEASEGRPSKEKRKPAPEVDEDGFTKVVGRRR